MKEFRYFNRLVDSEVTWFRDENEKINGSQILEHKRKNMALTLLSMH
jgi:hypothetical protein